MFFVEVDNEEGGRQVGCPPRGDPFGTNKRVCPPNSCTFSTSAVSRSDVKHFICAALTLTHLQSKVCDASHRLLDSKQMDNSVLFIQPSNLNTCKSIS